MTVSIWNKCITWLCLTSFFPASLQLSGDHGMRCCCHKPTDMYECLAKARLAAWKVVLWQILGSSWPFWEKFLQHSEWFWVSVGNESSTVVYTHEQWSNSWLKKLWKKPNGHPETALSPGVGRNRVPSCTHRRLVGLLHEDGTRPMLVHHFDCRFST